MYIKKSHFILYLVLALVAGFGLSILFGRLKTQSGLVSGDISEAARFNNMVVSPEMSAFLEKITNDTTEFNKTMASLKVLTSRMAEFDELVSIAAIAAEGYGDLDSSLKHLSKIKQLASKAKDSGVMAVESLNEIAEGKKSSINYELASQNLSLAFLMVDRQVSAGKQFVCAVDKYLHGKDIAGYKDLALACDLWAGYCAGAAVMNKDEEELDYWSKRQNLLLAQSGTVAAEDIASGRLKDYDFTHLQDCISIDSFAGLNLNESARMLESGRLGGSLQYLSMKSELSSAVDVNQMMQNVLPRACLMN